MNEIFRAPVEVPTVTIPLDEYRELLTKCARYELLQEQERQRQAEMEAFRASLAKDMVGDVEKPAPVTVRKSKTVEEEKPAPKRAISTKISNKDDGQADQDSK